VTAKRSLEAVEVAPENNDRLLYPKPEARRKLGDIGNTKLWELVNEGELQQVNIGRRSFITAESLHAYVARLRGGDRRKAGDEPSSTPGAKPIGAD
jgi:hypothetical protein